MSTTELKSGLANNDKTATRDAATVKAIAAAQAALAADQVK
jgi:hypothetical protein